MGLQNSGTTRIINNHNKVVYLQNKDITLNIKLIFLYASNYIVTIE